MYRDIVTVFNRTKTREGDIWYPTVIPGVNLNMDRGAIVAKYGEQSQDNCILNVRYKNLKKAYVNKADGGNFLDYESGVELDGGDFFDYSSGDDFDGGTFADWADEVEELKARTITWLSPKQWARQSDKSGYVTFAPEDFFWAGVWKGSDSIPDANYGDMSFFEYMTTNYDYVFRITNINYFSVIPHLEIAGR